MKSLWEEMNNLRPQCTCGKCTCGGVKILDLYHQTEYVMTFLMGLSESFTLARGQVLLMDPIPPINSVFALISQKEKQRTMVGQSYLNQDPTNSLMMLAKSDSKPNIRRETDQFVHIAKFLVTPLTSATNYMVFFQDINQGSKGKLMLQE